MFLVILGAIGCGAPTTPTAAAPPATAVTEPQTYHPAIDKSEVPAGAWMCDMGTVHYVAPGPGECPVCNMKLVQKH